MRYLKKVCIFLICLFVLTSGFYVPKSVIAADSVPVVRFIGVDHSPLVVGDSETFYITTNYSGNVQYRIFLYTESTKKYEELTRGYSSATDGKTPFRAAPSKVFQLGKYRVLTYVKRAGVSGIKSDGRAGGYDSVYTSYLNCVAKDNPNRIYVNDDMDIERDTYTLGETIYVNGIKNITGMSGPYYYKFHIFNPGKIEWTNDVLSYRDSIQWTPTEPGTYVLDLWAVSVNSTMWGLINSNPSARLYQAWKLKVITVKAPDKYISINEDTQLLTSIGGAMDERYAVKGEKYAVLGESEGFYKIRIGKVCGYIPSDKAEVLLAKPQEKMNVSWQRVNYDTNNPQMYDEDTDYINCSSVDIGLDAISPTWFYIKGSASNLSSIYAGEISDNEYVRRAHRNGYEVWPRFYEDDPNRAKAVFTNASLRSKVINDVVQYALDANADGVNIDFEGIGISSYTQCKSDFTAFVRDLAAKLHNNGISVSIDITRPAATSYSAFFDRAALSKYCDYVILMAYDEHYSSSPQPGSVGSYSWVESAIKDTMANGVPASKLILGNPLYTYDYSVVEVNKPLTYSTVIAAKKTAAYSTMTDSLQYKSADINAGSVLKKIALSSDGKWYTVLMGTSQKYVKKADFVSVPAYGSGMWVYSSSTLLMRNEADVLSSNNAETYYDNNARQTVATYMKDGIKHIMWLENLDSMNWRTDFVNRYNLKGAAAWSLGSETSDTWDAFKKLK